jgi:hypothetical protein
MKKTIKQDWKGNSKSVFTPLASSHHSEGERQINDYYATDPAAVRMLLDLEQFNHSIWEPACGEGHLSKELIIRGHHVISMDLIDRGYGSVGFDFLKMGSPEFKNSFSGDVITNPPYTFGVEFIKTALHMVKEGSKVAMFLKVQFMEGKSRKKLFTEFPPKTIYVSSSRINCAKNGDFDGLRTSGGSSVAYAWYVWEKGFKGTTSLKWFN